MFPLMFYHVFGFKEKNIERNIVKETLYTFF